MLSGFIAPKLSPPPDDRSKFLVNIPRVGRLIPPHFRPNGMLKSFTRVSRTKKKEHLSVDPSRRQFWKAGLEKARQKDAHVSARGDDHSRFPTHVLTCAYARCGGSGTLAPPSFFSGISPTRWRRYVPFFLSLSFFFFLTSGKTVGIRDMCVPIHTPRSWSAREEGGILVVFGKRGRMVGGRRTVDSAKGGKTRQGWEDDRTYAVHGHHKAANPWEYRACASGPARGLHELYGPFFSLRVPLFFLKPPAALCTHGIPARARRFLFQHVAALRGRRHRRPFCPQQLAPASCPSRECKGHIVARESLFNWLKRQT